ncbi:hypothetical protein [Streptococcus bouchesdurhonensis]|uniref:hypothetical protein n=1 Tax=Streptococcus bouchesdurhonensis TaxID=2954240 RepID=UPI0021C2FB17|nr:hypothetical protein [Streptococcus bouchesdurhonensis]
MRGSGYKNKGDNLFRYYFIYTKNKPVEEKPTPKDPQPVETEKPAVTPKPAETVKPTEQPKPVENKLIENKPAETPVPLQNQQKPLNQRLNLQNNHNLLNQWNQPKILDCQRFLIVTTSQNVGLIMEQVVLL